LNDYELLYIIHPRKAADEVPAVIEWVNGLVQKGDGEVLAVDDWGRRKLAYPIQHESEGTYVLTTLRIPPEATRTVESQMVTSEEIMRHILIRGIIPFDIREQRELRVEPVAATRTDEAEAGEAEADEAEAGEAEADEAEAGEVEAGEAGADEAEAGEVEAGEAGADEVEAGEAGADEVEPETVEAGEAGADEVEPETAGPPPSTAGAE